MTVTSSRRSPPPRRSSATHSVCETRTARCARRRWTIRPPRRARPPTPPPPRAASSYTATRASLEAPPLSSPTSCARATWTPRRRSAWSASPRASPNEGFLAQLSLWHTMGCKLNMADEAYRLYSVAKLAREREYNGYVNATAVQPDPGASDAAAAALVPFSGVDASAAPVGAPQGGGAEAGVKISCRKCRRLLARGANALPHQPGEGLDAFSWRRRAKTARAAGESAVSSTCQNVFLQPLAWMRGVEDGGVEGKLCCPRCDVKVGHFNWSGCQCSCGAWVTPAFYVQSGKVDVMPYESGGGGNNRRTGRDARRGGIRAPRFAVRPPVRRPSAGGGGRDGRRRDVDDA